MMSFATLGLAGVVGSGFTLAGQMAIGWFTARASRHHSDRRADVDLDAQRDKLTFDLLSAARHDSEAVREELASFRVVSARAAHLDEALDHIEALIRAAGEIEWKAAERRARAFLRRQRPEIGDIRQEMQRQESTKRVDEDRPGE